MALLKGKAILYMIAMNKWINHWINSNGVDGNYQEIEGKQCSITLEPRPSYCDRGNFIAKLFPRGDFAIEIDHQDGWPRYYFDEERAKAEVEAWLLKRKQSKEI